MSGLPQKGEYLNSWLAADDRVEPLHTLGKLAVCCACRRRPSPDLVNASQAFTPLPTKGERDRSNLPEV